MADFSHAETADIYLRQARDLFDGGRMNDALVASNISQAASLAALAHGEGLL